MEMYGLMTLETRSLIEKSGRGLFLESFKVPGGLVSSEASLLGSRVAVFSLCVRAILSVYICVPISLPIGTPGLWHQGPP